MGTPSPRVLHRLAGVIEIPYWTLMHLAGYIPADDADAGRGPGPRAEPLHGERTPGIATNERLLEELQAIKRSLDALQGACSSTRGERTS